MPYPSPDMPARGEGTLELRDRAPERDNAAAADEDAEEQQRPERFIRCSACDLDVARVDDVFEVGQPGPKVFVNPGGWVHEVVPVRVCHNTRHLGPFVPADTWFPGYAWQHCLCAGCGEHLGWRYVAVSGARPEVFWGLRHANIKGL